MRIAADKFFVYQILSFPVLASENIDSIRYEPLELVDDFSSRIKIFTEYLSFLQELNKEDFLTTQSIESKMFSLLNTLDSSDVADLSKNNDIKNYISANQYNLDLAVAEISKVVYQIWENDVIEWREKLNEAYLRYSVMVDKIPDRVFDEAKLEKFVYEPYKGKETLVKVYKLNMKQEANRERTIFVDRTVFLMNTFLRLTNIYTDLTLRSADQSKVTWQVEQIYNSLKTFEANKGKF